MEEYNRKQQRRKEIENRNIALSLENEGLRYCLESVCRQVEEIKRYAEIHHFNGDIFICATAHNILNEIKYMLGENDKQGVKK